MTVSLAADPLASPGIYEDIPSSVYHRSRRLSRSQLWTLHSKSPAHLKADLDNPTPPTRAMLRGSALHTAVLEPERFTKSYTWPTFDVDRRSNKGKEQWSDFLGCAQADGKEILGWDEEENKFYRSDIECILAIRERMEADPLMCQLLRSGVGSTESTYCWDEPAEREGVEPAKMRARFDRVNKTKAGWCALDLKSASDASPQGFQRALVNYGLFMQAAIYSDGFRACRQEPLTSFVFVAYETEAPFAHAFYVAGDDVIAKGREEYRRALAALEECRKTNKWPGYDDLGLIQLSMPGWYGRT